VFRNKAARKSEQLQAMQLITKRILLALFLIQAIWIEGCANPAMPSALPGAGIAPSAIPGGVVPSFNGIPYPNLATAYAAGCQVVVPPGYTETLTSNLVLNKPNCGFIFQGPATITMGTNQVLIGTTSGLAGPFIVGYSPQGAIQQTAGVYAATGGVQFIYTGSATAFVAGGASATPVNGLRLENFAIDLRGAGSAAIGINLLNVNGGGTIYSICIIGAGGSVSQVGLQTDNGGNFTGDITVRDLQVFQTKTGVLLNGSTEEVTFIGAIISTLATNGIGLDFEGDAENSANTFYGGVSNPGTGTGVKFGGSSTANIVEMSIQGSPNTSVSFGASATQNFVRCLGTQAPIISDSSNGSNTFVLGGTTAPTSTFANLGTPTNGVFRYCPDCTIANPCAGGGTGALAKRLNGVWVCN
jgi:hypothetical protein